MCSLFCWPHNTFEYIIISVENKAFAKLLPPAASAPTPTATGVKMRIGSRRAGAALINGGSADWVRTAAIRKRSLCCANAAKLEKTQQENKVKEDLLRVRIWL